MKLQKIPAELRRLSQWIGYKPIPQEGSKPRKVPINPKNGDAAKVNDPSTWSTIKQAESGMTQFDYPYIGFVFTENDPFFGVDQDAVRDPATGDIKPRALEIARSLDTYTETSCSETGLHHVGIGKLNGSGRNNHTGLEIYDRGRGFIFTANIISDFPTTIENRQAELDALIKEYFNRQSNGTNGRHNQIRMAVLKMRSAGASKEQAFIEAWKLAESLNAPGERLINEAEVTSIVEWVYTQTTKKYHLSQGGFKERFFDAYGEDFKYIPQWKIFVAYDGTRWSREGDLKIAYIAQRKLIPSMYAEAGTYDDEDLRKGFAKHVKVCDSAHAINGMTQMLRSEVIASPTDFDADPFLLNVKNGIVDLRTGRLCPHDKSAMLTKIAPVKFDAKAKCPLFMKVLETAMDGNKEKMSFLKRLCGYGITGDFSEQKIFLPFGKGSNAKGTIFESVKRVIGTDYSTIARSEIFMLQDFRLLPNELADLAGTRFITTSELGEGKALNEALVKSLTGPESIKARRLYQEPFEFLPTFKLFMVCNHLPTIVGKDLGIWRRICVIPFTVTITEPDIELYEKLAVESSGILNWLIEGCLEWQQYGLAEPEEVITATLEYRAKTDALTGFIKDCCILDSQAKVKVSELYSAYETFCTARNKIALSDKKFTPALVERGFGKLPRSMTGIYISGLSLKRKV